jgi:serine/threonine protein phosphatase PrpC
LILQSIIENDLNQVCEKISKIAFSNDSPDNLTCQIVRGKLPYKNNQNYISACHYNSSIPIWIDNVLKTAVNSDPKKRYETPTEFIKALSQPTTQTSSMLEKYPLTFWKRSAIISFIVNLILILWILILTN